MDETRYFASVETAEIGVAVGRKLEDVAKSCGVDADAASAYEHLYGDSLEFGSQARIQRSGDAGQLVKVRINKAKALLESLVGLILGPPLTWRPEASNADVESRSAVLLATNLLENFWKRGALGIFCGEWVKNGFAFRESYAFAEWDYGLGEEVGVMGASMEEAQMAHEGDLRIRHVLPWDAFFDVEYRSWEEAPWVAVRTFANKWDLAALKPKTVVGEDVIGATMGKGDWLGESRRRPPGYESHDVVPVFHWFHKPTPSVPQGRHVVMLSPQCVLADGPLEYAAPPVVRFTPAVRADSPFGDSQWQSTLSLQELLDNLESAIASNQTAFARQGLAMDERTQVSVDSVTNLAVYSSPPGVPPPSPIQLTASPKEVFDHIEAKSKDMTNLVGLNDVSQGTVDTAQMNASAFALLASMATQRNGAAQRRALDAIGKLGALVLEVLSKRITVEKAITIAGRAAKLNYPGQKWTGSDLAPIASVFVEVGNALEQTAAGRLQLAQMYAEQGALKTPEDLQQVVETGRLEQALQPVRDEDLLIAYENDEILAGRTPQVVWSDSHTVHAPKHRCALLTPAARSSPAAITAYQQHMDWHYREFFGLPEGVPPNQDPAYFDRMRALLGQPPPSALAPPPMGPPGAPPAGPTQNTPPESAPSEPVPALQPPGGPTGEAAALQPQVPSVLSPQTGEA